MDQVVKNMASYMGHEMEVQTNTEPGQAAKPFGALL